MTRATAAEQGRLRRWNAGAAALHAGQAVAVLMLVEHIRKGTLDFVLLKPADAQLLDGPLVERLVVFGGREGLDKPVGCRVRGVARARDVESSQQVGGKWRHRGLLNGRIAWYCAGHHARHA